MWATARRNFETVNDKATTIRLATTADAPRLAELRYEFRAAIEPVNEGKDAFIARCRDWMEERLQANRDWHCWVAEQGRTIIGQVWLQLIEKIPNPVEEPEFHAYISNFYMREATRGQGIGARLLQTALDWSAAQQVETVILWPTPSSRSLYLRYGFAVSNDILALEQEQ